MILGLKGTVDKKVYAFVFSRCEAKGVLNWDSDDELPGQLLYH